MPITNRDPKTGKAFTEISKNNVVRLTNIESRYIKLNRNMLAIIEPFVNFLKEINLLEIWKKRIETDYQEGEPLVIVFKIDCHNYLYKFSLEYTCGGHWQGRTCAINFMRNTVIMSIDENSTNFNLIDKFLAEIIFYRQNEHYIIKDKFILHRVINMIRKDRYIIELFFENPNKWASRNGITI